MSELTIDQKLLLEAQSNAKQTRLIGAALFLFGGLLQLLHLISVPIRGFPFMVIIAGIILSGSGILFILGSYTLPQNRSEFVKRFQKIMLTNDPERRLWAAQRLIGYMKDANFTREDVIRITKYTVGVIQNPPVADSYKEYIAGDHLILLREIAVAVDMDKHTRREFVRLIRPLKKLDNLSDEAYELLADALAYHPDKLPVQAFADLKKMEEEDDSEENIAKPS